VQATGKIHAVAVRFDGRGVVVHDPAREEPARLTRAEYAEEYGGPAVALIPRRRGDP